MGLCLRKQNQEEEETETGCQSDLHPWYCFVCHRHFYYSIYSNQAYQEEHFLHAMNQGQAVNINGIWTSSTVMQHF